MAESSALSTMKHIILLSLVAFTFVNTTNISDKRKCADKDCQAVISRAKALASHGGNDPMLLQFNVGDMIDVTSKSAGSNQQLWGGVANGHRGYFDKNFVRETKVHVRNPQYEVDTEGDVFAKLGKPPSDRGRRREDVLKQDIRGKQDNDVVDTNKIVDQGEAAAPRDDASSSDKPEEGVKTKHPEATRKNEEVEDLLDLAKSEDAPRKDGTDLSDSDDDDDDDSSDRNVDLKDAESEGDKGEGVDEGFWDMDIDDDDDDDDEYIYERERDRFDTADLNQFIRRKLWDGKTTEDGHGSDSQRKDEAFPRHQHDHEDHTGHQHDQKAHTRHQHDHEAHTGHQHDHEGHEEHHDHEAHARHQHDHEGHEEHQHDHEAHARHQHKDEAYTRSKHEDEDKHEDESHSKAQHNNRVPLKVEPEVIKESYDLPEKLKESGQRQTDEGIAKFSVDDHNDDDTHIKAGEGHKNDDNEVKSHRHGYDDNDGASKGEEKHKDKLHTPDDDFDPTEIDDSEEDGKSFNDNEDDKISDRGTSLEDSKDAGTEKEKVGGEKDTGETGKKDVPKEESVLKTDRLHASNEAGVDLKKNEAKDDLKDLDKKSGVDGKHQTNEDDASRSDAQDEPMPDTQEVPDSQVRPDTPSGEPSPEYAQGEDPISLGKGKLNEEEADLTSSTESQTSKSDPSLKSSTNGGSSESGKKEAEDEESGSVGGGFDSFIESSRVEPHEPGKASSTPELGMNPTTASITEAASKLHVPTVSIESSKTNDQRQGTANDNEDNKKLKEEEQLHTMIEEGSTMVFDKKGHLVTAILPEAQTSVHVQSSAVNSQQVNPTATKKDPEPSVLHLNEEQNKNLHLNEEHSKNSDGHRTNISLSGTESSNSQPNKNDDSVDGNLVNEAYHSLEFNSRKVLSVNQAPPSSQQQQPQPLSEDKKGQQDITVAPTPVQDLPHTSHAEHMPHDNDDGESRGALDGGAGKASPASSETSISSSTEEQLGGTALGSDAKTDEAAGDAEPESSTQPTDDGSEIPPTPTDSGGFEPQSPPEDSKKTLEDYNPDATYHSRKITDEDLFAAEEQEFADANQGFARKIFTAMENMAKNMVNKLPPSVLAVLEPFGLMPNFKVLVITFTLATLISGSLISCCFPGGASKKQQQELLVKFDELERKRMIDVKEKQNLEDEIASNATKNLQMKDEITKLKEELKKHKSEHQTVQLHNETLKKQLSELEERVEDLKESASTKQGEVKQQSKKTKDLEKQLKKLQERETALEQTTQKLTLELKHKEEELALQTSKVSDLTDQVGHLQNSKDQLLAEAEDWKEKVADLKDRLGQREDEFQQMEENIMFKENELEVLKDCFLQLKAFEETEQEGETSEDVSARVQEKVAAMIDVSKVNASLRAIEEEKLSLANKLEIELEARRELEEQLESSRRSVETSMSDKMKAERQCQEAQTKLNVLSSYFKEKEMQLQRELGEQEALKKQNQNKLQSADETTRTVQQELEFIRTQNESLKRELASSERDFRSQIAANEKKAHENWLSARAAERELKEARHEAGVLRQKLTDLERRQFMGPGGLIRPLPTRGLPPSGVMNGPPPPGMERSPSRGDLPPLPPPHLRDDEFLPSSRDRGPPFPLDPRRGPVLPPGMRPPHPHDARSPPPRMPPFGDARSSPPRMPPPGMLDGRSPPPYDRRPPPPHMLDRRSPPFRLPPPDMLPPPMRDGRFPMPPYGRNPPPPSDRASYKQGSHTSPQQQQQSHV